MDPITLNTTTSPNRDTSNPTKQDCPHCSTSRLSLAFVLGLLAVLSMRLFHLASRYAVNILFSDQWDFDNATLFQKHSLWEMYDWQHGPHRQGLGAILQKVAEPAFHWNSRTESFLVAAIITLTAVAALLLKQRLHGAICWADSTIPLIFLASVPYTSLLITANFAHGPLPVLLLIAYGLSWTCADIKLRYSLVVLINFLAIYTGFGIFLGFLTPLLLVADYLGTPRSTRARVALFTLALLGSLASLASFFSGYRLQPAADCFSFRLRSPVLYVRFVGLMFANVLGAKGTGFLPSMVGTAVVAILILCFVLAGTKSIGRATSDRTRNMLSATFIAFSLLFAFNTAFGRLCLGLEAAQSPRYTEYLQLGMFGAYLYAVLIRRQWLRNIVALATILVLAQSVPIRASDQHTIEHFSHVKSTWKSCYLKHESVADCDRQAGFWVYPWPDATHLKDKLEFLKQNRLNLYSDAQ